MAIKDPSICTWNRLDADPNKVALTPTRKHHSICQCLASRSWTYGQRRKAQIWASARSEVVGFANTQIAYNSSVLSRATSCTPGLLRAFLLSRFFWSPSIRMQRESHTEANKPPRHRSSSHLAPSRSGSLVIPYVSSPSDTVGVTV